MSPQAWMKVAQAVAAIIVAVATVVSERNKS